MSFGVLIQILLMNGDWEKV